MSNEFLSVLAHNHFEKSTSFQKSTLFSFRFTIMWSILCTLMLVYNQLQTFFFAICSFFRFLSVKTPFGNQFRRHKMKLEWNFHWTCWIFQREMGITLAMRCLCQGIANNPPIDNNPFYNPLNLVSNLYTWNTHCKMQAAML